ncbi:MAG: hypothetical protein ACP5KK_01600 [Candidatus Nanoarchaeia archaeon]
MFKEYTKVHKNVKNVKNVKIQKMQKAQTDIIAFLLIIAMAVIIVSLTFFWATPLIEQTRDEYAAQKLRGQLLELCSAIKTVANEQGALSTQFEIPKGTLALLTLEENTSVLKLSGQYKLANPAPQKVLFGSNQIDISGKSLPENFVSFNPIPLGEEPCLLVERGALEFFLYLVPLNISNGSWNECYRIILIPGEQAAAGTGQKIINLIWTGENITNDINIGGTLCNKTISQLVEFTIR